MKELDRRRETRRRLELLGQVLGQTGALDLQTRMEGVLHGLPKEKREIALPVAESDLEADAPGHFGTVVQQAVPTGRLYVDGELLGTACLREQLESGQEV